MSSINWQVSTLWYYLKKYTIKILLVGLQIHLYHLNACCKCLRDPVISTLFWREHVFFAATASDLNYVIYLFWHFMKDKYIHLLKWNQSFSFVFACLHLTGFPLSFAKHANGEKIKKMAEKLFAVKFCFLYTKFPLLNFCIWL